MDQNRLASLAENDSSRDKGVGSRGYRWLVVLSVILALAALGLGFWGYSEHNRAERLVNTSSQSIVDLSAFESAFESGDYNQVRALFTDDGIMTTASDTWYAFSTGAAGEGMDVNGTEFKRLATVHGGGDFQILGTPIRVENNTVAFGWQWTGGVSGTALLHLRDGKIVIAILNPSQVPIP